MSKKVQCYCCDKWVDKNKANGVFADKHYYFCQDKLCQQVFDDMATVDKYIYD